MRHLADTINSKVIDAHMNNTTFELTNIAPEYTVALFDASQTLRYGDLKNIHPKSTSSSLTAHVNFKETFYFDGDSSVLVSTGANDHLGIHYVVVQSQQFKAMLLKLQENIFWMSLAVFSLIVLVAIILSKIFMRPIHKKMQEIETFVKNTAHELNTPIAALMMSTSRAQQKKVYDEKVIRNISISTKQLHDMYRSLTFLSFEQKGEAVEEVNFKAVVQNSIKHFNELLESKKIAISFKGESCLLKMVPSKADMLINNLLGNAIKYSPPQSTISMTLTENHFTISDKGIGISKEKLKTIFLRFRRANDYAGGFGVGLSIVKSICNEYDINVDVISKEHEGTQFTLTFK